MPALLGARLGPASGVIRTDRDVSGDIAHAEPSPTLRDAIFRRFLIVADLLAVLMALRLVGGLEPSRFFAASLPLLPVTVLLAKIGGRYDHDEVVLRKSTLDEIPRLMGLAAAIAVAWSLILGVESLPHQHGVGGMWAITAVCLIVFRMVARMVARRSAPRERVLVIGNAATSQRLVERLATDPIARTKVVGFLPLEDARKNHLPPAGLERRQQDLSIEQLDRLVSELKVQRIFVVGAGKSTDLAFEALGRATTAGVKVSMVPNELEVVGSAVEFDEVGGLAILSLRRPGLGRSSRILKRGVDVVGAGAGLFLLSPLFALIALAIAVDSKGGVFFRQRRVGREGQGFELLKFRSMVEGAEAQQKALEDRNETNGLFKLSRDPRVTRVGRVLRRSSLDELPQLINVLRGEMSLVGPRPLVPREDCLVEGRHRRRLHMAPGMTGPWQILGPKRPCLSEMVKIDFLYASNWSIWNDVKILLRTLSHVAGLRGL